PAGVQGIQDVVAAYRRGGGSILVVGHAANRGQGGDLSTRQLAALQLSMDRTAMVARELVRLGVDAAAVRVTAVPSAAGEPKAPTDEVAEIFIEP
ncbi:MAG: hypothetical protein HQL37_13145, partial [Alphaproteobacteria bacterium]|nr:hypothetical protein [Alphaproteobacteria bacterium]